MSIEGEELGMGDLEEDLDEDLDEDSGDVDDEDWDDEDDDDYDWDDDDWDKYEEDLEEDDIEETDGGPDEDSDEELNANAVPNWTARFAVFFICLLVVAFFDIFVLEQ